MDKETIIIGLLLILIGLIGWNNLCCFLLLLVVPGLLLVLIGLLKPEPKGIMRILDKW